MTSGPITSAHGKPLAGRTILVRLPLRRNGAENARHAPNDRTPSMGWRRFVHHLERQIHVAPSSWSSPRLADNHAAAVFVSPIAKDGGLIDRFLPAGVFVHQICAHFGSSTHDRPICGRWLMPVKRRAPSSCRHGCRRKEPLPSGQRAGRMVAGLSRWILRAGRDNFRDNNGDSQVPRKSKLAVYLAFSMR